MANTLTVINVTDITYAGGAKGNGVHDDSDAIIAAFAAVPMSTPNVPGSGAIVYLPAGNYLITKPLKRTVSGTRCVGEGKDATWISIDPNNWSGTISPADPTGSFMLDLQSYSVKDCTVEDLTLNGAALNLPPGLTNSALYSGILCSVGSEIIRVTLNDIWGYGLWISDTTAAYTKVIDCDADLGFNPHGPPNKMGGNDCIGGGAVRTKIVRFHWMPGLKKNTALDFTTPGGATYERSVDIIDCINESPKDVVLEGLIESTIRGCRFYGNNLNIKSNGAGQGIGSLINPRDILVANCVFDGGLLNPLIPNPQGGSCKVSFDGGDFMTPAPVGGTLKGGRVAILGNKFYQSYNSAIQWGGDDASTSIGGSIIADNAIYDPNQSGITTDQPVAGVTGPLGSAFGCGIAILSSYGVTIGRNTIEDDTTPTQNMQYSVQLISKGALPTGSTTARIIVTDNLCGNAPGAGNGAQGTFYFAGMPGAPNPTDAQPLPILRWNTNQDGSYDSAASNQILTNFNSLAWPGAGGYPYDAVIYLFGSSVTQVISGVTDTELKQGTFNLPAGEKITIKWTGTNPTIKVFR
jgi:hypothetical protein